MAMLLLLLLLLLLPSHHTNLAAALPYLLPRLAPRHVGLSIVAATPPSVQQGIRGNRVKNSQP